MKQVSEKEIREAIRYVLRNQNEEKLLVEYPGRNVINFSGGELWDALVQPWIDVLKIAKLEAQKTLANVLTLMRVMTSFNRQKQQNIMDNHKDRMRSLDAETETLLAALPVSTDMAVLGFLLNPGAAVASTIRGADPIENVAEFFRGAGFGDFTPAELSSPDRNSIARARKREQSGLIAKALRGLNSIFMAGYDPTGDILAEQEEKENPIDPFEERDWGSANLTPEGLNLIIDENGGLPGIKEAQDGLMEEANEFLKMVQNADELVSLLTQISDIKGLDGYMAVMDEISRISPETGLAGRAELEASLDADVKSIASQEGAEEEAAKMFLRNQGITEPSEEELAKVTPEQKQEEIRKVAFGNILVRLQKSAGETVSGIYESHKETYDTLYNEEGTPAEILQIINDSPYGKIMLEAEKFLKNMETAGKSLGV